MLDWIRGARVNRKTAIVVVLLALVAWAIVVYVNVRDFVPEELSGPNPTSPP